MSSEDHMDMDFEKVPETVRTGNKMSTGSSASALPPKPTNKFTKRAEVWKFFIQREDDSSKSKCKYCGAKIGCDTKLVGTSSMKSHIVRCKLRKEYDQREIQQKLSSDESNNMKVIKYDLHLFRRSVNELVVVNELSFSFVELEGWKRFCANILPMYNTFSRRTCTRDIDVMYMQEKISLKSLFGVDKKRVSVTTDIWVSPTTSYNYMVVTAHWIDVNWHMQKRILSFKVVTGHKGDTIAGHLLECLDEWGIEKVFTMIADNAKGNDNVLRVFADALRLRGLEALVQDGDLLHMRCCAHILNLIVGDGLKKAKNSIVTVRNAVKYVRSNFQRLKSFVMRCETGKIARGILPLDVVTRWNSTYLMLTYAIKLRPAFEKMSAEDKLYCDYFLEEDEKTKTNRVGPPTSTEWDEVQRLVKFLKIFYRSILVLSASKSVASTLCYTEIVNIEKNLINKCGHSSKEVRDQAHLIRDKFEKYWDGLLNIVESGKQFGVTL